MSEPLSSPVVSSPLVYPPSASDLASSKPVLSVQAVSKQFAGRSVVREVSLEVLAGEFFCLLGPSGCGKSTLLRMIAGLEQPDSGQILVAGRELSEYGTESRPLHMVFQSYALFPHLTVFENIAFGLRMRGVAKQEIAARVTEMIEMVQLSHATSRKPERLSGGERQRVALARALVNRPKLLLLDEPLAAVDRKLRASLQTQLKEIQKRTGVAFVCVTHDQDEAMILGDRIGLMYQGKLAQVGSPHELYQTPQTLFTARFVGDCTAFTGTVKESSNDGAAAVMTSEIGELLISKKSLAATSLSVGSTCTVVVRPERVDALTRSTQPQNKLSGVIEEISYLGSRVRLRVLVQQKTVIAEFPSDARLAETARVGKQINVLISPEALVSVVDDMGDAIHATLREIAHE